MGWGNQNSKFQTDNTHKHTMESGGRETNDRGLLLIHT